MWGGRGGSRIEDRGQSSEWSWDEECCWYWDLGGSVFGTVSVDVCLCVSVSVLLLPELLLLLLLSLALSALT